MRIRTLCLGSARLVQGVHERTLANGLIVVRVGRRSYVGRPVPRPAEPAALYALPLTRRCRAGFLFRDKESLYDEAFS